MGGDGKEYGPVTPEDLIAWRAEGRLDDQSLLRPEGSQVWGRWIDQPFLNRSETKELSNRERELKGAIERLDEFPFGAGIFLSVKMFMQHAGMLAGGLLVFLIIYFFLNLPDFLGQTISLMRVFKMGAVTGLPGYVDWILGVGGFFLTGLFDVVPVVGFCRLNLHLLRGEKSSPFDILWGFSHRTFQFALLNVMMKLLCWAVFLSTALLVGVVSGLVFATPSYLLSGSVTAVSAAAVVGLILGGVIAWAMTAILQTFFIFAPMLVMERNRDAWSALVDSCRLVYRKWGWLFLYFFVAQVLSSLGILLFGIGVILTLPIYYTALVYAYLYLFDEKVEPSSEIGVDVLVNAGVLPGLGTWMRGDRKTGAVQMTGAILGAILAIAGIVWYLIGLLQSLSGNMDEDAMCQRLMPAVILICIGLGVFMCFWLWAVFASRMRNR